VLWKACDTFRGTIDVSEYKNDLPVTLSLNGISDAWQERDNSLKTEVGDDAVRIFRRLARDRFVLPKGSSFGELGTRRGHHRWGHRQPTDEHRREHQRHVDRRVSQFELRL
jgi:type I restriction enzyme M protein